MPRNPVHVKAPEPLGANRAQASDLLCQALETELGAVQVYLAAVPCAHDPRLREQWELDLGQARVGVKVLEDLFEGLGLDPALETAGRRAVRALGACLVHTIMATRGSASPQATELVACECVLQTETKDWMNWQLIGALAQSLQGDEAWLLRKAFEELGAQKAGHQEHAAGVAHQLWLQSLGIPELAPPTLGRGALREA